MPSAAQAVTGPVVSERAYRSVKGVRMRFFNPKTLLAGSTALVFVVACGGGSGASPNAGTSGPVGSSTSTSAPVGGATDEPAVTLAPDQTTGTAGEATAEPGGSTTAPDASASPSTGASWTDIGAIAIAIGPSALLPMEGTCTIAPPPEDPEAPPLPNPGPGDLPFIAGSTFTVSLADAGTTTP